MKNGRLACSTATLIKSNEKLIICDPGCNRKKLLTALNKEWFKIQDIDYVVLTHWHVDHALLAGIFENAKLVTFENLMYDKDLQLEFDKNVLGPDIKIINTPGHSPEHISLLVNTDEWKYAIAGDVFWRADDEKQTIDIDKEDDAHPAELHMKNLKESRRLLLKIADYIIPWHGKTFKSPNNSKADLIC